jgi:hypothetical protein
MTFETSVDNYFTRQYIPEDNSELHTRRRENLKSQSEARFKQSHTSLILEGFSSARVIHTLFSFKVTSQKSQALRSREGFAVAQAVRQPLNAEAQVCPGLVRVGFIVDKLTLRQVSL